MTDAAYFLHHYKPTHRKIPTTLSKFVENVINTLSFFSVS